MNLSKMRYFEKIETPQQKDFLCAQNNCILCSEPLELHHMQLPEADKIKEDAYCNNCDIKARTKDHTLH
jgi:hypothetical protein